MTETNELESLREESPELYSKVMAWLKDYDGHYDKILKRLHVEEGGYVYHHHDPGGETNHGITRRVAQAAGYKGNMRTLPKTVSNYIYVTQYIHPQLANIHPFLAEQVIDFGVNAGTKRSITFLQDAISNFEEIIVDGIIGPKTVEACNKINPWQLACVFRGMTLKHYAGLSNFRTFGTGWTRRVARRLEQAADYK